MPGWQPTARPIASSTYVDRSHLGIMLCGIVVVPLVLLGNPAVALLTGGAIALLLDRVPLPHAARVGRYSLQAAIVLLGLKLDLMTVWSLSAAYTWGVALFVVGTLCLGWLYARALAADRTPATLVVAGTAICGGTTIAALSPVIGARPYETAVTLTLVFLLNAVALLTFPLIGAWLDLSELQFGLWAALAIHDTSSVVATATLYGEHAAEVAIVLKLGRTLWLIPLILIAGMFASRQATDSGPDGHDRPGPPGQARLPGFILAFLGAATLASVVELPALLVDSAGSVSKALLVLALFAVGCELTRETLKRIRGRVFWLGISLWLTVVSLVLAVVLRMTPVSTLPA